MNKNEHLTEDETLLYTAEGEYNKLYLTNKRVIYTGKTGFFSQYSKFKDIEFHHISSIEGETISHTWLLISGFLAVVIGLTLISDVRILVIIIGIILLGAFYLSKKSVISFITEHEKISFRFNAENAEIYLKEITKIIRKFN